MPLRRHAILWIRDAGKPCAFLTVLVHVQWTEDGCSLKKHTAEEQTSARVQNCDVEGAASSKGAPIAQRYFNRYPTDQVTDTLSSPMWPGAQLAFGS